MKDLVDEMEKDFKEALECLDVKYDPFSKKFMKALFIGQVWLCARNLEDDNDIEEELEGAKKYLHQYQETSDIQYREMASDELKHAGILIKKHLSKNGESSDLKELEDKRQELLRKVER